MEASNQLVPAEKYREFLNLMPVVCVDLLVRNGPKLLLVKRNENPLKGEWWVPGGRIFKGETVLEACYRKLKSETGLHTTTGFRFVGYYEDFYDESAFGVPCHSISIVYETEVGDDPVKTDGTIEEYKWDWGLPSRLRFRLKP